MNAPSRHLAMLGATTRPAGSAGANEARAYCAAVLRDAGFTTGEHEFTYSKFAGAWGMPIAGLAVSLSAIGIYVGIWVANVAILSALALGVVLAALAYVGRNGVLDFPALRRTGINLAARRDGAEPTVWLVAHIDSKWQPVSMFARVAGLVVAALGLAALLAVALFHLRIPAIVPAALLMVTWMGSVPMMLSIVGEKNHGALDNASGVAAVLEAAELLDGATRVGVLITDAEELGLAGARAWARSNPASVALNCDSVDDAGQLLAMYTGTTPRNLLGMTQTASAAEHEPMRARRLIPGILTDSVALTSAGWTALTLSRGTVRTLGRIHTSRDTLAHMRGTGIAGMARVLARTATELG